MQQIKAVLFDMDGTLANTLPLCIEAFRQTAEPLVNRPLSDAEIESHFGPNEAGAIKAIAPGSDYNQAAADFVKHYEALHHLCPTAFEGVPELLKTLHSRGIHLAIVSGKGKEATALSLQRFGIDSFFPIVKNGTLEGGQKPGDIADIIATLGTVTKEETIYVGDAPTDMQAARTAGVAAIAAAWAPTAKAAALQQEKPDEIFHSLPHFTEWLNTRTGTNHLNAET